LELSSRRVYVISPTVKLVGGGVGACVGSVELEESCTCLQFSLVPIVQIVWRGPEAILGRKTALVLLVEE
jgi:hypothetical protein